MNGNDLLEGATPEQRKWVAARILAKSDAQAARDVGVSPATVCRWPNKATLDEAVAALLADPIQRALNIMTDALPKAADVKVAGLSSRNESIRQAAASDVLDRGLGKALQTEKHEVTVSGPLVIAIGGVDPSEDI